MTIGVPHHHAGDRAADRSCDRCGARFVGDEICPRCGAILGRLSAPLVLDERYELERTLGVGSMGVVHLARDLRLGHLVAIKMIAPEIVREEPEATRRFAREAATLSAIRSPHVVRVHTYGQHGDVPYFVMEYVHGRDVGALVEDWATHRAWVPVTRALTILRQVILGIESVHAAGIIHRDIKPANVIIEEGTGRPVLVDFGVARSFNVGNAGPRSRGPISTNTPWGRHPEAGGTAGAGTPCYMAPEQLDDDESAVTPRTDVYALGCTAFEIFAARPPFESFDADELMDAHLTQVPPRLSSIRTDLARFDEPIARALRKRPDDRFPSAAAFFEELEACADDADLPPAGSLRTHPQEARRGTISAMVVSDDDHFVRVAARALQQAFEGRPLDITPAHSDEEAVTLAQWSSPRLVIVDDDLLKARGRSRSIDAIARLRGLPIGLGLHVILASSTFSDREGREGREGRFRHDLVGVGALVGKPLDPHALRIQLDAWAQRG